jgi:hypothetical protein
MGLLVFLLLTLISAVLWHRFLPKYSIAVVGAMLSAVLLFQGVAFVQLGYLDPFAPIAALTSGGMALIVSLLVGLPIRARRRANAERAEQSRGSET